MLRVLLFALRFSRLREQNPHLFDPKRAITAVLACLEDEEYARDARP